MFNTTKLSIPSSSFRRALVGVITLLTASAAAGQDSVVITGSERMVPLLKALAAQYNDRSTDIKIEVNGGGARAGILQLVSGSATVASLARPATDQERNRVRRSLGEQLVGIPIAIDAVVVVTHRDNPASSLTLGQLRSVLRYEARNWNDLGVSMDDLFDPRHRRTCKLDHTRGVRITVRMPQADSDTDAILRNRVMGHEIAGRAVRKTGERTDAVQAVASDLHGLGFCALCPTEGVKLLAVRADAESPAALPTSEAVQNRAYPLAHYLYLYFAGWPEGAAGDFLTFILSPEGRQIITSSGTGIVALPFDTSTG